MRISLGKKTKAVTGILLASAMVAGAIAVKSFNTDSKASTDDNVIESVTYDEIIPEMQTVAKEYAVAFAEQFKGDDFEAGITTPIYSSNNNVIGYSVAITKETMDYGYVNVDFSKDDFISDFAIEENSRSIYDALSESFAKNDSYVEIEECQNKLLEVDGYEFAVSANDETNGEIFYYNGTTYEDSDFEKVLDHYEENYLQYYDNIEYEDDFVYEATAAQETGNGDVKEAEQVSVMEKFKNFVEDCYPTIYNVFWGTDEYKAQSAYKENSDVFSKTKICDLTKVGVVSKYSKEKSLVSQDKAMLEANKYACALIGTVGIVQQEGMILNNSFKDTVNKLWEIADCEKHVSETETLPDGTVIKFSGTYPEEMPKVVTEYAKLFNKNTAYDYRENPSFEFFKASIDADNSTSFGFKLRFEGGHGVNVVGYAQGQVQGHDIDYLITSDGWYDDAPRYVLYKESLFSSTNGCSYKFTDM